MHKELNFRFIPKLFILFILLSSQLHSFAQDDEQGHKVKKNWPAVVNKITDLGLPADMVYRVRRLNKAEMDSIKGEDYHENYKEGDDEYVLKVMLRFVNGKIIGFVKKEPMMQSNQGTYLSQIDIPLTWCGTDSLKQEHCVQSEEEMSKMDSGVVIAARDWHQKLDALEISTDVVSDNIDMLRLLESKSGRKKLQSKKTTDNLKKILPQLAGEDSVHVAQQLALMLKEEQEAKRRKLGGDFIPDSTLEVITAGLTGPDSIAAIKKYLATRKAEKAVKGDKKYQKGIMGLDTATIASITKGLSGADSINALKNYLEPKVVKAPKKQKTLGDELDSATLATVTKGLTGSDSVNAIRSYVMEQKASKKNKKQEYNGNVTLDSTTIASVTKGLSGQDSVVALRNYVNAERESRKHKKRVKEVAGSGETPPPYVPPTTSTTDNTQPVQQAVTPTAPVTIAPAKPTKTEKKKKKSADELDETTIATITQGLTGADSINAIREYKIEASRLKNDHKRKKVNKPEQVITADTTANSSIAATQPTTTPIVPTVTKQDTVAAQPPTPSPTVVKDTTAATVPPAIQAPSQPTVVNDTTANKKDSSLIQPTLPNVVKDSTAVAQPVVPPPPVENKPSRKRIREVVLPTVDSTKNKIATPTTTDSTANTKPLIPIADSSKVPVADSTKPK